MAVSRYCHLGRRWRLSVVTILVAASCFRLRGLIQSPSSLLLKLSGSSTSIDVDNNNIRTTHSTNTLTHSSLEAKEESEAVTTSNIVDPAFSYHSWDRDGPLIYLRAFRSSFTHDQQQHQQRLLTFLHIPKTGGTSVESVAARKRISWGCCRFPFDTKSGGAKSGGLVVLGGCPFPSRTHKGTWRRPTAGPPWWHIPRQFFPLGEIDPYANAEVFVVVRSTLSRMISEFYWKCRMNAKKCDAKQQFNALYLNEWMQENFGGRQQRENSVVELRGHFAPQYPFVVSLPNEVRMADHVLSFENLTLDFARLMKAFSLDHLRLDNTKYNANSGLRGKILRAPLGVEHLNNTTKQTLRDAFADDLAAFGGLDNGSNNNR